MVTMPESVENGTKPRSRSPPTVAAMTTASTDLRPSSAQ